MSNYTEYSLSYLENIKKAGSEAAKKDFFFNFLTKCYVNDAEAMQTITNMIQGSEKTVYNIPLSSRNKTGRADTQYHNVIIEFEKDLKRTLSHAKVQLQEYVAGNWNSSNTQDFVLIATDALRWVVYAIAPESFLFQETVNDVNHIKLEVVQDFTLNEENAVLFFYFIDSLLLRTEAQVPTLDSIDQDFGAKSSVFRYFMVKVIEVYKDIKTDSEIQTAYHEWEKFLSVAYGSFKASDEVFLIHTYLSIFAKLLGYATVSKTNFIESTEIRKILTGEKFKNFKIENYVENDFFQWVQKDKYYPLIENHIIKVVTKLADYEFSNIQGDILKGVYQGLIDVETRHALGEYYTPDWLCEQVVESFSFEPNAVMMDPSCGSGSFLLAMMKRIKELYPDITAKELANQIVGIDIHPLSVQIAKTTLLIGLEDLMKDKKEFIHLRIYLANSIIMQEDTVSLLQSGYKLTIDNKSFWLHDSIFQDNDFFDNVISLIDSLAETTSATNAYTEQQIVKLIQTNYAEINVEPAFLAEFHDIYMQLRKAKQDKRDSIWKYVLQNNYKPYFLKHKFDYIIGNPPWFTYSSVSNAQYQSDLKKRADSYHVTPKNKKNMANLEIAAIFMAHCGDYYLKPNGKMAFVVPRSFLQADQHNNTRKGEVTGFYLSSIWDLKEVKNLFNIPSCVLFSDASQKDLENPLYKTGIEGRTYKGNPIKHNATWQQAKNKIEYQTVTWHYSELNNNSSLTTQKIDIQNKGNYYAKLFSKGAELIPRNFYFIDISDKDVTDWTQRVVYAWSSEANDKDAKAPWKDLKIEEGLDAVYIFRTALSKNIIPFGYLHLPLVTLPIEIVTTQSGDISTQSIKLLNHWDLMTRYDKNIFGEKGNHYSASWFKKVEDLWNQHKTENNANVSHLDWINWQQKLTQQDLNKRYLVIYNSSAKDANACIIDRVALDRIFIADTSTYVYHTDNLLQAHYVCAFLNSKSANEMIKSFQSTGLFGARNVHKKILDVPFPRYEEKNANHQALATLGKQCAEKAHAYLISKNLVANEYNVGRLRLEVRAYLSEELAEIDKYLGIIQGE